MRRLIIGGLTALAIGLGVTPSHPPHLRPGRSDLLHARSGTVRPPGGGLVKQSTGMMGQYADYNVAILTQQLAYQTCPRHSGEFGAI